MAVYKVAYVTERKLKYKGNVTFTLPVVGLRQWAPFLN